MHLGNKKISNYQIKFVYFKVIFVIAVILLCFLMFTVFKVLVQKHNVNNEVSRLKIELQDLEKEQGGLIQMLEYFQSDEFVKQEGKIKFGLRDQGENLVVISDKSTAKNEIKFIDNVDDLRISNWKKWLNYFFN